MTIHNQSNYLTIRKTNKHPRIPLEGSLDLTYRCNLNCRHCWVNLPVDDPAGNDELSFDEIRYVVDEARASGCREWNISGGEPMLRDDFAEILDYLSGRSIRYTLNSNGTLITPPIAELMTRKGVNLIAIYGATAEINDHITRREGSFEAAMRGISYLREANANFTLQIIPMRDSYHQLDEMIAMAAKLDAQWRIGSSWLFLAPEGETPRNREISRQRLSPETVIELDKPAPGYEQKALAELPELQADNHRTNGLYSSCIANRNSFHIDPYGGMSFCGFVKDPSLRYELCQGNFSDCWERFIPQLRGKIKTDDEYLRNCDKCEYASDCRWCPVYGYLEHGRHGAKVEYLCGVAHKRRHYLNSFKRDHRRYYGIAGINLLIESDLPITDKTFAERFKLFELDEPEHFDILIEHHFDMPAIDHLKSIEIVYDRSPWTIYKRKNSWVYKLSSNRNGDSVTEKIAEINPDSTWIMIFNNSNSKENFHQCESHSLTLFPTDQVIMAKILAERGGFYIHASGVILDGHGLLFAGCSDAGKTTIANMLSPHSELLCDDRIIIRSFSDVVKIYGTWSHGDLAQVSSASAPLQALMFLNQAESNSIQAIDDPLEIYKLMLTNLIRPHTTLEWWEHVLDSVESVVEKIPAYRLNFNRSGEIVRLLKEHVAVV